MSEPPRTGKVRNRAELRRTLENRLITPEDEEDSAIRGDLADQRSVKPKTYLIESNSKLSSLATRHELLPSDDPTLWNLQVSSRDSTFYMYLDTLDPRFWVLHSTFYADESDAALDSLVTSNVAKLDYAWLSSDTLLDISKDKPTTAFGINYTNLFAPEGERSGLSARVWGKEVPYVLRGLRAIREIQNQISVNSVTLRNEVGIGYVNEDIFRNGKMTAKGGDSIDNHLNLIDTVKEHYKSLVQEIEQDFVTRYVESERYSTLQGTYSVIEFSSLVPELSNFADTLSAGIDPFRLWGVWRRVSANHSRMKAIDLHTNTPVELELLSDELRIILGDGACGNVVPRLFTNIQARFDSECKLRGLDDGYIIRPHQAS